MSGICLIAGLLLAPLDDAITLRWMHSIEKIIWEEDYRREREVLRVVAARVQGTGAGMEPPAGAVLREGTWHYVPALPPLPRIELQHSPHAMPYEICSEGACRPVSEWLPGLPAEATLVLEPCTARR